MPISGGATGSGYTCNPKGLLCYEQRIPTKMITFALPKGRILKDILRYVEERGFQCSFGERELIAYDHQHAIQWLLVKNNDLPIYLHKGSAILGISGSDMLMEYNLPLCRLAPLPFGRARLSLISQQENQQRIPLDGTRIATKYPHITHHHFAAQGIAPTIIKLNGSLELAPLLGLAPYVVDIVQSGATIRAHNLVECYQLFKTEIAIVANNSLYKFYHKAVDTIVERLRR